MAPSAELAQRLSQASAAHAEYEMTALHGEYDRQWAEWYARYLLDHDWNELFTQRWSAEELTNALRDADAVHRLEAPHAHWQDFYAERLLALARKSQAQLG